MAQLQLLQRHAIAAQADMAHAQKRSLNVQRFGQENSMLDKKIASDEKMATERNAVSTTNANIMANAAGSRGSNVDPDTRGGNPVDYQERTIYNKVIKGENLTPSDISSAKQIALIRAKTDPMTKQLIVNKQTELAEAAHNPTKLAAHAKELGIEYDKKNPPSWQKLFELSVDKIEKKRAKSYLIDLLAAGNMDDATTGVFRNVLKDLSGVPAKEEKPAGPSTTKTGEGKKMTHKAIDAQGVTHIKWSDGTITKEDPKPMKINPLRGEALGVIP
jgi:hypothetical protein